MIEHFGWTDVIDEGVIAVAMPLIRTEGCGRLFSSK